MRFYRYDLLPHLINYFNYYPQNTSASTERWYLLPCATGKVLEIGIGSRLVTMLYSFVSASLFTCKGKRRVREGWQVLSKSLAKETPFILESLSHPCLFELSIQVP